MIVPSLPASTEYRVWCRYKVFAEEAEAMHVVAEFRFLQEALDYIAYVNRNACDAVLTGPSRLVSVYRHKVGAA